MKKVKGFAIRPLAGKNIIIGESLDLIDFNKLIELNSSAAFLWENMPEDDFYDHDIANLLVNRYGIDYNRALNDVRPVLREWIEAGIVEP